MKPVMVRSVVMVLTGMCGTVEATYVGDWENIDSGTGGIVRIGITQTGAQYSVHTWASCSPAPCDWGIRTAVAWAPVSVEYDFGFKTVTLTLWEMGPQSLYVSAFHDFIPSDPRQDYSTVEYFKPTGSGPALPDLMVDNIYIPKTLVLQGASPWTYATPIVKNLGPGILESGTLRARLTGCTRNGETFTRSGFFTIPYTAPLMPGQQTSYNFAVGHDSGWPVGVYSIRLRVDPDGWIDESDETNNLSPSLGFYVAEARYLAGRVLFNHQPLHYRTSVRPGEMWINNANTSQAISGYDFGYDPQSSRFLISGLPNVPLMVVMRFDASGGQHKPGNFDVVQTVTLPSLTDAAAGNYDLSSRMIIHLIEPWDNRNTGNNFMMFNCEPFAFSWEAVPGATKYHVKLDRYRDTEHPVGFGYLATLFDFWTSAMAWNSSLAPSAPLEHYQFYLTGYNDADELLGALVITYGNGYGADYRFKVCGSCPIGDINHDCIVSMPDFAMMAEHWLESTR